MIQKKNQFRRRTLHVYMPPISKTTRAIIEAFVRLTYCRIDMLENTCLVI